MAGLRSINLRKASVLANVLAVLGLVVALAGVPTLIPLLRRLLRSYPAFDATMISKVATPLFITIGCTILGMILTLLLLNDVRHNRVFSATNVVRLRVITYCGFLMVVPCVVGAGLFNTVRIPFIVLAALLAAFLGVLMFLIRAVMQGTDPPAPPRK